MSDRRPIITVDSAATPADYNPIMKLLAKLAQEAVQTDAALANLFPPIHDDQVNSR